MTGLRLAAHLKILRNLQTKMSGAHYSMSFTTGGLLKQESAELAELYLETPDWQAVRERVISNNLLQARTLKSSRLICNEIIARLKRLSRAELSSLPSGSSRDQAYILWIAICRRYEFIGDFATEVLRERYIKLQPDLSPDDFEAFFHKKAEWHTELERLSDSTHLKLRQVLFKLLRDVGLLSTANLIQTPIWNPELVNVLKKSGSACFQFFPVFDADLQRITS
jgi:hypothetical protein